MVFSNRKTFYDISTSDVDGNPQALVNPITGQKVKVIFLFFQILAALLWIVAGTASFLVVLASYYNIQPDWDNQLADNIINSSIRPVWAASIGWLVFACKHGYGGKF